MDCQMPFFVPIPNCLRSDPLFSYTGPPVINHALILYTDVVFNWQMICNGEEVHLPIARGYTYRYTYNMMPPSCFQVVYNIL